MNLFKKECPVQKFFKEPMNAPLVIGNHSLENFINKKLSKQDCLLCKYWRNNKCNYNRDNTQDKRKHSRGLAALAKRSAMDKPFDLRYELEKAALSETGLSRKEQKEYWNISKIWEYHWHNNPFDKQGVILDCLEQWQKFLESGLNPERAYREVINWLEQEINLSE
ncbi:MAG: hypothetical protein M0R49_06740 [Limnochordia bacterium]|jgi:hypothetical protein|nr:hypothetical protein [Limnochordia bacterium]